MPFFITGFMGAGKTTIGKEVAKILAIPFVDLDEYIEQSNAKTISEFFKQGEWYFRQAEDKALREVIKKYSGADVVIALGGGTQCKEANSDLILNSGVAVYLKQTWEEIEGFLDQKPNNRPILGKLSREEVYTVWRKRCAFYSQSQLQTPINTAFSAQKVVNFLKLLTNR